MLFLGSSLKEPIITIPSVRLYALDIWKTAEQIVMKFDIGVFENYVGQYEFWVQSEDK
jgi:hypothetical protein